jgi:hypothetical protein
MVPVSNAQTIPDDKTVQSHNTTLFLLDRLNGLEWFLPAVFIILWFGVVVEILPGVLLPAVVGLLIKVFIPWGDSAFILVLPLTVAGILLGLVGGLIDRARNKRGKMGKPWGYILSVIGMLIGVWLGLSLMIITST